MGKKLVGLTPTEHFALGIELYAIGAGSSNFSPKTVHLRLTAINQKCTIIPPSPRTL